MTTVVVNPKSMTIKQLFGFFDEGLEWKDGILATSLRNFSNMSSQGMVGSIYGVQKCCCIFQITDDPEGKRI